jgi:hypothetical protein
MTTETGGRVDLQATPRQNLDTASRSIDDTAYVLNPETSELHAFNEVGGRIWELIDGERTLQDVITAIADEYDVEPGVAEADVVEFVETLVDKGVVTL